MLIIGLIASVIGVGVALLIDWFPIAASRQSHKVDTLYDVLLIVSVPVFVLVEVVVLFSVWKFRMRPGEELKDGPPIHGSTRLEIIWTALPAMLLVGLCAYAYAVLHDIEKAQANTMKVGVTGQQFAWSFTYPHAGGKPITSPQLYLPKDRPIEFDIQAKDVIHSFFVPAFRIKQDAVPGITTHTRTTPDRLGVYPLICAELCGIGHAVMRQNVHVVTPARFNQWLAAQGKPAVAAGREPGPGRGRGQAALHERHQRLLELPHARRRRRDRQDRPRPRQGPQGQGQGVHPAVDRRPERLRREGLPERHNASDVRQDAVQAGDRRARELSVEGDPVTANGSGGPAGIGRARCSRSGSRSASASSRSCGG